MPWDLLSSPLFASLTGGSLVALTLWLTYEAVTRRRRQRNSGFIRFAPDGACWFGQSLDDTPSTDAEKSLT